MADLGPGQHHHIRFGAKRLQQQEDPEKEGNDGRPNHRECTDNNDERDRRQRQLEKLVLDCDHMVLPRSLALRFIQRVPPHLMHCSISKERAMVNLLVTT